MTARSGMSWLALACGLFTASLYAADETAPPATNATATSPRGDSVAQVARLIHSLGDSDYTLRQSADDQLVRLGAEAREPLLAALRSDDAEVRLRAQSLIDRILVAELWAPSMAQAPLAHEPASRGFEAVARETHNHLFMGDAHSSAADPAIDLSAEARPFWQAVDELCRKSGNHVRPNYDSHSPGLIVVAGAAGQFPTAYAGPLRAQLTGARRLFAEELDFESGKSSVTHTFQFNVQFMWEDRLRLVAYTSGPTLVEAIASDGKPVVSTSASGVAWNVTNASTRQVTASMRITPPPIDAKTLSVLRLKWGLVAVGDMRTARFEPLVAKARFQHGDLSAQVESLERQSAGRTELTLILARDLAAPEPQEALLEENNVELLDQNGVRFRPLNQSNSLTEGGVQMKLSFVGESAESQPAALEITYPRLRSRRELEIVFREAPLPVGRPE